MIKQREITNRVYPVTKGTGNIIISVSTDSDLRATYVDVLDSLERITEDFRVMYASAQCVEDVRAIDRGDE